MQLESSAPFGGDDHGIPFAGGDQNEGEGQTDPLERRIARRVDNRGRRLGGSDSREGDVSGHNGGKDDTWNSSEIRDRRRPVPPIFQPDRRRGTCFSEVTAETYLHLINGPKIGAQISRCVAGDSNGSHEAKVQWLQVSKGT